MKLEEAIERDETIIIKGELGDVLTAYPAIQLGIEAMKRFQAYRKGDIWPGKSLLPGETKD